MKKRMISTLLIIVMLLSLLPTTALADGTTAEPILTNIKVVRIGGDKAEAYVSFDTTFDSTLCEYYYEIVDRGVTAPDVNTSSNAAENLWNNNDSSGNHGTIVVSNVPDTACDLYLVVRDNVSGITYQPIKIEIPAKTSNTPFKTSEHLISGFADNNNAIAVTASAPAAFTGTTPTLSPLTEAPGVQQSADNQYTFKSGAQIALYDWDGGTAYTNKVTLTHTGNAWINDQELYWGSGAHSFVGLVPESMTPPTMSVSGGTDYLVANLEGASSGDLSLQFEHIMSRLDVNLDFDPAYDTSKISNIAVQTTLKTGGTYTLDNGITETADEATITFAKTYYAVPQEVDGLSLTIYFTYDGQPMSCTATINGNYTLTGGDRTTVNVTVDAPESFVSYIDADGTEKTALNPTLITSNTTALSTGWYYISGTTTISSRINVSGDVHLILCDNVALTAGAGIGVNVDNSLTIYGQKNCTGALTANADSSNAGIGGTNSASGTIVINGGIITANGGNNAAGIGGGKDGYCGENREKGIFINGGVVTAAGGSNAAGIGSGYKAHGVWVTINGGTITATGNGGAAGIGHCLGGDGAMSVIINGGSVKASSISNRNLMPKNTAGDILSEEVITIPAGYDVNDLVIKNADDTDYDYSKRDMQPDANGKLYLWLPNGVNVGLYSITYNTNGGTINGSATYAYTQGDTVTLPTDVTKDGHEFLGWYEDEDFSGNHVTEIPSNATGDKTFYAKWEAIHQYDLWVGGVGMNDGEYLASGGDTTTTTQPDGGYAHYANGVLTLNGYDNGGAVYQYSPDSSSYSAAIYSDIDSLTINLVGNNILMNAAGYGVLGSGDMTIGGTGSLAIDAATGIVSYSDVTISGGTMEIDVASDISVGIAAVENVTISGGMITIDSGNDGINTAEGDVTITGGVVEINAGDDGICTDTGDVTIEGDSVLAITADFGIYTAAGDVTITGGTMSINATTYGIASYGNAAISGNTTSVTIIADEHAIGIAATENVTITGGTVEITAVMRAIDAGAVFLGSEPWYQWTITKGGAMTSSKKTPFEYDEDNIPPYLKIAPNYIASVTINGETNNFDSFSAALDAVSGCTAADNAEVKLLQDVELDATQEITGGVFTLDLNGHSIGITAALDPLKVSGAATHVTITDSTNTDGTIDGGEDCYAVNVVGGSTVTISGGSIVGNAVNGHGIHASGSTLNVSGGTVTATYSGVIAVSVENSAINISGGTVTGDQSGVAATNSTVTVTGGTIMGGWLSGVHAESGCVINISGGTISSDIIGLRVLTSVDAIITDGTITGNSHAIYVAGNAIISGGSFRANPDDAQDIFVESSGAVTLILGENGVGASFPGGLSIAGKTLREVLAEGVAFWQGDKQIVVGREQFEITGGDVVVKKAGELPPSDSGEDDEDDDTTSWWPDWPVYFEPTYPPVVDGGDNGDVSVTPKNPEKGDTVVITPAPDAGYEVDEIIVTDKNDNPVTVVDNGDGTYSFKQPSGKVNIEVTFRAIVKVCPGDKSCPMYGYTDLDMTAWYHDGVHYCIEHGLMGSTSTSALTFEPNLTTTRAMIITILWRLEGCPDMRDAQWFEDVPVGQWYSDAIAWAAFNGIVDGYGNGYFGTNDPITREQFVTIMFRYAKYKGYDVSVGENTNILSYDDAFDVADWAIPAMQWACGSGMIQGIADGNMMYLEPQGNATRAQAAAILQRFIENVVNEK